MPITPSRVTKSWDPQVVSGDSGWQDMPLEMRSVGTLAVPDVPGDTLAFFPLMSLTIVLYGEIFGFYNEPCAPCMSTMYVHARMVVRPASKVPLPCYCRFLLRLLGQRRRTCFPFTEWTECKDSCLALQTTHRVGSATAQRSLVFFCKGAVKQDLATAWTSWKSTSPGTGAIRALGAGEAPQRPLAPTPRA